MLKVLDVLGSPERTTSSAWSVSVRAWCSVPDMGTGKALKGVTAARAPGHCHHQCWDAGALPWSSSRGPGACALMLAKLT